MRTMVFVDYWNLQVTLQREDGKLAGLQGGDLRKHRFNVDWFGLGPKLTELAATHASPIPGQKLPLNYEETRFYTSNDPKSLDDKYKRWAKNTLGGKPGIHVFCLDRKIKHNPHCPHCYTEMDMCPHCHNDIKATQEKGVDTLLVTDMLSLGLDGAYDVAILVSQDADMAPAARYLGSKGIKVIQVGIKHFGAGLASECWANFDLFPIRGKVERVA